MAGLVARAGNRLLHRPPVAGHAVQAGTKGRRGHGRDGTVQRRLFVAVYWRQTVIELRPRLVDSGKLDDRSIDMFLAQCADPAWWTQTIAFTAVDGRAPGGPLLPGTRPSQ